MDWDEGKLFIGGVSWNTTDETLREHFSQYGDVSQVVIMRDKTTGRPRGFAFVVFSEPALLDRVLLDSHTIDGRTVEAKRALSRNEQQTNNRCDVNSNSGRGSSDFKTRKIFVGGLPSNLTEEDFREYFERYGPVADVVVMYDQNTQRPRGFGFVTFDGEDSVDRVLHKTYHEMNGKLVEVKRALPKDAIGGGSQGHGGSGGNVSGDGNWCVQQPQRSGGGYGSYSGYNSGVYGYGGANNGSGGGYANFGNYGVGGYGSGGAYGMPGTFKNPWGGQDASGYVANSGYGTAGSWTASGTDGSGSMGQVYGYGNYGGNEGNFSGGYGGRSVNAQHGSGGASGVEQQGRGGGYNEVNGNSRYGHEAWSSEPSQVSGGYGSGYGSAQSGHQPYQ